MPVDQRSFDAGTLGSASPTTAGPARNPEARVSFLVFESDPIQPDPEVAGHVTIRVESARIEVEVEVER